MADDTQSIPVDSSGLLQSAQAIRQTVNVNDPKSLYYQRPEAAAKAEANIRAAMLRAGVSDPGPASPEQIAAERHDASFRLRQMPVALAELIDQRAAAVGDVKQASAALRQQLGDAEYDQLVENAKHARADLGGEIGDLFALRSLANYGKYIHAYKRTAPGRK